MVNRSKVGKHQLQPKMISSETWRRFSKLFRVSPPGVPKSKSSIRKILRVDAEVERMCSAVQVSVAISQKLQATQRGHFYHFWISHEIIMTSCHASRCCIPAALAEVIANLEVGRAKEPLWSNSLNQFIPTSYTYWVLHKRNNVSVTTSILSVTIVGQVRQPAPHQDCEHLGSDSCLRSGWILVQQGLLWEYNFETEICHLFNPTHEVRRDEMSRLDK